MVVARRALELHLEDAGERLVVEEPRERVAARLLGELRGGAVEVRDDALGDEASIVSFSRRSSSSTSVPPEPSMRDARNRQSTRRRSRNSVTTSRGANPSASRSRAWSRATAPAGRPPASVPAAVFDLAAELGDEGRHVAELRDSPEPRERRDRVVRERLVDHRERQLPRVLAQLAAEGGERRCQAVVELLHGRKTRTQPES